MDDPICIGDRDHDDHGLGELVRPGASGGTFAPPLSGQYEVGRGYEEPEDDGRGEFGPEILEPDEVITGQPDDLAGACLALRDALSLVMCKAPGYDWNADPLGLTRVTGAAFTRAESALTNVKGCPP